MNHRDKTWVQATVERWQEIGAEGFLESTGINFKTNLTKITCRFVLK
jgi:hypothetical protein